MFDWSPGDFAPLFALSIPIIAIIGGITAGIVRMIHRQRAFELMQRERIAAIERGLDPDKIASLQRPLIYDDHGLYTDPAMAAVIRRAGPCGLVPRLRHSPFEELLEAIVYQQLSGKAAATIYGRVRALFPPRRAPAPQALLDAPEEALRGAGLSRAKLAAARDLAART